MGRHISAFARRQAATLPLFSASAATLHDPDRSLAEQSWENEGGDFSRSSGISSRQAIPDTYVATVESLSAQTLLMARTLYDDLANGRVGKRYNTFEHRSRILRQLTSKLEAVRRSG